MDTIQNSPRNRYVGSLADSLLAAKRGANQYEVKDWVPLLGGTGLGDLFMGKAPELADDASYQGLNALYRGGNLATGGIGTYGADPRTVDAAFLGADALGLGKLGTHLAKRGASKLIDGATNLSRRDFLKKTAALGGTAALGAAGLGSLRTVGKNTAEEAAKNTAKEVATAPQTYRFNSLQEYSDYLDDLAKRAADYDMIYIPDNYKRRFLLEDERAYNAAKEAAKNPNKLPPGPMEVNIDTGQRVDYLNAFSPQAKAEMKAFKQKAAAEAARRHKAQGEIAWNSVDKTDPVAVNKWEKTYGRLNNWIKEPHWILEMPLVQ